ncbi:MAG TPA: alpha/beta fold hydrolase [Blastocatellia bacterium]|nr:alpha/beta fold hydrolase [Blastocatellia bacterium]
MPFAQNQDVNIFWELEGKGEPVLLIMGLGYTREMWHRIVPALSSTYSVITLDNRGVGATDRVSKPFSIANMADDAALVLDAAGVDRAHVFGISMGGMIAQELALRHSSRLRSLILGCTTCGGPEAVAADPEVLEVLQARATMAPAEGVRAMVPYIYDARTPRERVEEDLEIRLRTFPAAQSYLAQLRAIQSWSSHNRLSSIGIPTLVIHGESDRLIPPENGRILARAIPGAKLSILESASHIFPTDQPAMTLELVTSFFSDCSHSSAP